MEHESHDKLVWLKLQRQQGACSVRTSPDVLTSSTACPGATDASVDPCTGVLGWVPGSASALMMSSNACRMCCDEPGEATLDGPGGVWLGSLRMSTALTAACSSKCGAGRGVGATQAMSTAPTDAGDSVAIVCKSNMTGLGSHGRQLGCRVHVGIQVGSAGRDKHRLHRHRPHALVLVG